MLTIHEEPLSPDIISDMKYFVDNGVAFRYEPNNIFNVFSYKKFMEFVDTHLALQINESGKTLVDGVLAHITLIVDKGAYKVICELYLNDELLEYQKYCDDKFDEKEMKYDEMIYEAESDAREEAKELLNDESND